MVSWNVTGVDELTKEVDANTKAISSLTSTVNSDHSEVVKLEGMQLLSDHFYVLSTFSFNDGLTTIGSFSVSAGDVIDFEARFGAVPSGYN